ncbi:MAG: GNAT family N-acetyltransferase [Bacteroidota bacterium]
MPGLALKRTNSTHADFKPLVAKLDAYLAITDGDEHAFYDQYNQIDNIKYVVLAYDGQSAIGCGAIKCFDDSRMEVKRMWVDEDQRGGGAAAAILDELEKWASELGAHSCILETGKRQHAAVKFYQKRGYKEVPKYGQYVEMDNSICFEKVI